MEVILAKASRKTKFNRHKHIGGEQTEPQIKTGNSSL